MKVVIYGFQIIETHKYKYILLINLLINCYIKQLNINFKKKGFEMYLTGVHSQ